MREQHDLGAAAQPVADVRRRCVTQHLAREVLRRVQDLGGRRRNHGADIAPAPHELLQAGRQRRRIDGRGDNGTDAGASELSYLLDHQRRVVAREGDPEFETAVAGGERQSAGDALHELAFVVLCEGQNPVEARWRRAGRRVGVERREDGRDHDALRPRRRRALGVRHRACSQ